MRLPTLKYDRGTIILHPPPQTKSWIQYATWDDRIEKFRVLAQDYRTLLELFHREKIDYQDQAREFIELKLNSAMEITPYPHQIEALNSWHSAGKKGVVVLPTGAGKTFLAQLAMTLTNRSTLIVVPTIDLMHQWYAHLLAAFCDVEIGLLGGGSRDRSPILISTYDSAAIQAETLGNLYGLIIFDECHHLPSDFYRVIAELSIAPYRLGLSATPERSDGKHQDLATLIGTEVYRKSAQDLAGNTLAPYQLVQIKVKLSQRERSHYHQLITQRNQFLKSQQISLGSLQGWQRFVKASSQSSTGRQAMLAHRQAKEITLSTEGKIRVLSDILCQHHPASTLIFTSDNATVYRIAKTFLIPAITHQTPVKERHDILTKFREGVYKTLVASQVLNEGVDVPAASIAIILSGSASQREFIQRLGRILRKGDDQKKAILYEVISEDTVEENIASRRQMPSPISPSQVIPLKYPTQPSPIPQVAEDPPPWDG